MGYFRTKNVRFEGVGNERKRRKGRCERRGPEKPFPQALATVATETLSSSVNVGAPILKRRRLKAAEGQGEAKDALGLSDLEGARQATRHIP